VTDCERLLEALSDGRPKSHRELYALGMIVHSRVSDLRKKGHDIRAWRQREWDASRGRENWTHYYRLITAATLEAGEPCEVVGGSRRGGVSVASPAPSVEPVQLSLGVAVREERPAWA
jgi:hypothetical protein